MQPTLDERKKMLVDECLLEYSSQPRNWWEGGPDDTFKSTWDIYQEYEDSGVYAEEITIYSNKSDAISGLVMVSFIGLLTIITTLIHAEIFVQLIILPIFGFLIYYFINKVMDDKPRMIFNPEGLWTKRWGYTIPWPDMVVSCIRTDTRGKIDIHFLRIHFYDPYEDNFKMGEINLSSVENESDAIACFVQQFRMDYGKTSKETYQPEA